MLRTLLISFVVAVSLNAQQFGKVQLWDVMENGKTQKIKGSLEFSAGAVSFSGKKDVAFDYAEIDKFVYERTATPRYKAGLLFAWPLLFTKGKKHFLTVHAAGDSYAVFRLHKSSYRMILTVAEAKSGHAVEREEER